MGNKESEILERVLPEDYLELFEGRTIRSLSELVEVLNKMSDEEFRLYVYGDRNDFAEWILEAYWDDQLTRKIFGIQDRKKMVKYLLSILKKAKKKNGLKIVAPNKKKALRELAGVKDV